MHKLRRQNLSKKLILTLAFILMLIITGCNLPKNDPDIASVNGVKITRSQFDQQYNLIKNDFESKQDAVLDETKDQDLIDRIKSATFDELVMQRLIRQDAQKNSISIDSAEVDAILNNFKQSKNGAEVDGYQKFLSGMKMSEKDLQTQIEISQLYDKLRDKVAGGITISDAAAEKYYKDNPSLFEEPGGIQIYHILVDTEQKAAEVMAKLKQGNNFATLAKEYSIDPGSKDQGGDLGLVNDNTNFVPEFKKAALALQSGQLSPQAIKTDYGYHIIKAGNMKTATLLSFEQVKEQLKLELANEQQDQTFQIYLEQLMNNADIKDLRSK